jgi:hypothetical protein
MWACLAGAIVFAAGFVASRWYWFQCWGTVRGSRLSMGIEYGSAYVFVSQDWPPRTPGSDWMFRAEPTPQPNYEWWGWFWPWRPLTSGSAWFRQLALPAWLPAAGLGIAGAVLWRVHVRARRTIPGVCGKCGYSRHGLDVAAACPECGEARASAAT